MSRAFVFSAALIVCALAASARPAAQGPQASGGQGQEPPSAVEQAVIEHRCNANRTVAAAATEQYQACLSAQLLTMRNDFGIDLKRLSEAERKTLDSACSRVRTAEGRDAYVACLSNQLWALHNRRVASAPAVAAPAAVAAATTPAQPAVDAAAAASVAAPPRSIGVWIGVGLGVVVLAAAAGAVALRRRPRASACRACGVAFSEPGDMCPACRHQAAEALRRAAAERERAAVEEQRQRAEREEELRRRRALEEEQARRDQEARAREQAEAREREEQRRRDEEVRERQQYGAEPAGGFDPHAVLDVMPGATLDELRFAYEQAMAKYDASLVSHLSEEVQAHYRAKAEAVERAYRLLIASAGPDPSNQRV